jgi:DNA polymerase elongation subunit (family B)
MNGVIFDIETVGERFDDMDALTQENLTRWLAREAKDDARYQAGLKDVKEGLGFSPLTGQIVALGMLDSVHDRGAVYFQADSSTEAIGSFGIEDFEENGISYKVATEAQILSEFWRCALSYREFVSFNGRAFDVPFIMIRSAICGIRPTKDLLSNRYLNSQKQNAIHIDLLDQLSFYGALQRKGSLHLWSRAFGIESPKIEGITGDDVAKLFSQKQFVDIARYNARDLFATRELYRRWQTFLRM